MGPRPITHDDLEEAGRVFVESLGGSEPLQPDLLGQYWQLDRTTVVEDARGRIAGVASGFATRMSVAGGGAVPGTGVPNVGVRADAQGRGLGRTLLEDQVRSAAERGDGLLVLNSSEAPIYGRYGYGPSQVWWRVQLDPRGLVWRPEAPRPGDVVELPADEATDQLRSLYARCFGRWPGEVERHDGWWAARLVRRPWHTSRLHVALHHGDDGEVDAAAVHTIDSGFDDGQFVNSLAVHDVFGVDDRAQVRLLRWLTGRRLLGSITFDRLDPGSPLPWVLDDMRRVRTVTRHEAVWARVLDPAAALDGRATTGEGRVVVRLHDRQFADVAGCWAIEGDGVSLTCRRTDEEPQVVVGVDLLASLAWSYVRAAQLAAAGRCEVVDPAAVEVLDRLLAWHRPSWCSTSF